MTISYVSERPTPAAASGTPVSAPQFSYRMILYAVHSSALRVHLRDGNKSSVVVTRADVI